MDESSYTMSYSDDLCMKKDQWEVMFGESQVYDKLEEASKQYVMKMEELKHGVGKLKNPKVLKTFIVIPTPLNAMQLKGWYTFVEML